MKLLMEHQFDNLTLLYRLYKFNGEESLKPIAAIFKQHVIQRGKNLVESVESTSDGKTLNLKEILANSNIIDKLI